SDWSSDVCSSDLCFWVVFDHNLFPCHSSGRLFFPPEKRNCPAAHFGRPHPHRRDADGQSTPSASLFMPSIRPLHPKHHHLLGRPRHWLCVRDECRRGPFGLWLT